MLEKIKAFFTAKDSKCEINKRLSRKLHNMHFKYISEKDDSGQDTIIGRGGHINIEGEKQEILCATSGVETLFRLEIAEMSIWEFMSLDGCVITFFDLDKKNNRAVKVYYDKHLT